MAIYDANLAYSTQYPRFVCRAISTNACKKTSKQNITLKLYNLAKFKVFFPGSMFFCPRQNYKLKKATLLSILWLNEITDQRS